MTSGIILKPKPLIIAGTILLGLVLGAIVGLVFLGGDNNKGFSKEELFTKQLESVGIVVEPHAPEVAKALCKGNTAGNAAMAAILVFPDDELKAKTYIDSVVELCK